MHPPFDALTILSVLGPVFLVAGLLRCVGQNRVQGRTWLIVGAVFCLVAVYLWQGQPHPH